MKAFVDAHALLWAIFSPDRLSPRATSILKPTENTLLFSHASLAELLNKSGRGKLPVAGANITILFADIVAFGVQFEAIREQDILRAAALPHHHSDPFDRLLIAQAIDRQVPIISADQAFQHYDAENIW